MGTMKELKAFEGGDHGIKKGKREGHVKYLITTLKRHVSNIKKLV